MWWAAGKGRPWLCSVHRRVRLSREEYLVPLVEVEKFAVQERIPIEENNGEENLSHPPDPSFVLEQAKKNAEEILRQANDDKEKMLELAQREAVKIRDEALKQGYDEGKTQGIEQGEKRYNEKVAELQNEFLSLAHSLQREKEKLLAQSESELVALAVEIAKAVVHQELLTHREIVVNLTHEAVSRLIQRENLTVRVNPEDLDILNLHKEEILQKNDLKSFHLVEDIRVPKGGVIVESSGGQVDGRIETQFQEVGKKLKKMESEGKQ